MTGLLATAWRYWRADRRLGPPLQVGFAVNNTCNTFCQMCNIWKMRPKEALGLEEIRRVFGHRLFRHCASVSLTGGEPTLRRDLAEIPVALAAVMPALRRINLTSNGYATAKIVEDLETFLPALGRSRVSFSINLSIDGVGAVHDGVRGNPRAFACLDATVEELRRLRRRQPFNLALACTFTRDNVADAENVLEYARAKGLYVLFRNAFTIQRIGNLESFESFAPGGGDLPLLERFYERLLGGYDRSHARRLYYRMLLRMMGGGERDIPCLYRKAGLFIDHRAEMYVCTVFSQRIGNALEEDPERLYFASRTHRDELACSDCRGCSHDVTLYTSLRDQVRDRLRSARTGIMR